MIRYHTTDRGITIAEIVPGSQTIDTTEDLLDIMGDTGYNGSAGIIIHRVTLNSDFFDLKTKFAGEILQKFSNYRMKLAIIGDFSDVKSKSLRDFIRESNTRGIVNFVASPDEAFSKLDK
jgi:hypothetical protein